MKKLMLIALLISSLGCTKIVTVEKTKYIKIPIPEINYEKFEKPSDIPHKVNAKGQGLFEKDGLIELDEAFLEYSEGIDSLESIIDNYNEYIRKYNEGDVDGE